MKFDTYEQFLEHVKGKHHLQLEYANGQYARRGEVPKLSEQLKIEWRTGGQQGGSCWDEGDDDHHYAVSGDPEPAFESLDQLLEEVAPGITYLQYKGVERLMKTDSYSDNEYYGNYTEYATKAVPLRALYDYLAEKGFIS